MHYPDVPVGSREPDRNRPEGVVSVASIPSRGLTPPCARVSAAPCLRAPLTRRTRRLVNCGA